MNINICSFKTCGLLKLFTVLLATFDDIIYVLSFKIILMARLSKTWRITVCLPLILFITSLSSSTAQVNQICRKRFIEKGITIINRGMDMMYGIKVDKKGYYPAVKDFYNLMKADEKAFATIKKHLRFVLNDMDTLIGQGKTKFKDTTEFEEIETTQALLIYLYTTKSETAENSLYYKLNKILRDHSEECTYDMSGEKKDDFRFAPYAAALTATLLHWGRLETADTTTYRSVKECIHEDNDIIWYSFISSSLSKTEAANYGPGTSYTIDNKGIDELLQPKLISKFSAAKKEEEALYAPGSVFQLTNCHNGKQIKYYDIALQNIKPVNEETPCDNWYNYP